MPSRDLSFDKEGAVQPSQLSQPQTSFVTAIVLALTALAPAGRQRASTTSLVDVTVHEGTSMSVAVSPDGRTLAVDLQGSIWTLPSTGGTATRITDLFNDARQPA